MGFSPVGPIAREGCLKPPEPALKAAFSGDEIILAAAAPPPPR
ncbi:MAG: hypothetical protein AB7G04_11225 [Hyphomonadaceae bacterium]